MSLKPRQVLSPRRPAVHAGGRHATHHAWTCALIASTNKDRKKRSPRALREDLFYRLQCGPFSCRRALRERKQTFRPGARVSGRVRRQYGRPRMEIGEKPWGPGQYHWPGNVAGTEECHRTGAHPQPRTLRLERKTPAALTHRPARARPRSFQPCSRPATPTNASFILKKIEEARNNSARPSCWALERSTWYGR